MPVAKYNAQFGGKKGAASKALASMRKQYGDKGTSVFYATVNKRKKRKPRVIG